jgi:hypothetical protein
MTNVFDLSDHVKKLQANQDRPVPLEDYNLPNTRLLMDPALQLSMLSAHSIDEFVDGQFEAAKIHRMFTLLKFMFNGVAPEFDLATGFAVRENNIEKKAFSHSIYAYGHALARVKTDDDGVTTCVHSFEIEVSHCEFDGDDSIDSGIFFPVEEMRLDIPKESCMSVHTARHFIRKMNELIQINGGFGAYVENGYAVAIPYSGMVGTLIFIRFENPIVKI